MVVRGDGGCEEEEGAEEDEEEEVAENEEEKEEEGKADGDADFCVCGEEGVPVGVL